MKTKEELDNIIKGVKNWYYTYSYNNKNGLKYIDKAIKLLNQNNSSCLERQLVNFEDTIDQDMLFSEKIEDSIKYLIDLKNQGYESIGQEWSGYETNYFVAVKKHYEDDKAFYKRCIKEIDYIIDDWIKKEKELKDKKTRIEKLEKELKDLKKSLNF